MQWTSYDILWCPWKEEIRIQNEGTVVTQGEMQKWIQILQEQGGAMAVYPLTSVIVVHYNSVPHFKVVEDYRK